MDANIRSTQSTAGYISNLLTKYGSESAAIASELTVAFLRTKRIVSNSSIVFYIGFSIAGSFSRLFLDFGEY